MRINGYLLRSVVVAALGGLLFGFDTAVISGTTDALKVVFRLDSPWLGLSGGFWLGVTVASPRDRHDHRFDRRRPPRRYLRPAGRAIAIAVLYVVSSLGMRVAWNWGSFLFARFVGGLAIGGASVVSPMYIAEISPAASADDWWR